METPFHRRCRCRRRTGEGCHSSRAVACSKAYDCDAIPALDERHVSDLHAQLGDHTDTARLLLERADRMLVTSS
eukprot:12936225-Prorocentrum_lima.AAC.1